ncbi:MAG: Ppx/GppA phosphatase family protein [Myxococcota bacterium]
MRVAAVDIGTNSVHMVVADVGPEGGITVVDKSRVQVELGRGGLEHHTITDDALARALAALESFATQASLLGVEAITTAATSAVREAKNGSEFCDRVTEATGLHVRVISGVDEARLIWLGARPNVDFSRGPALLIDIGGGSVELVVAERDRVISAYSYPLGHLRTTEQFVRSDPPTADEIQAIRKHVRQVIRPVTEDVRTGEIGSVVGTSGSIRTLGRMATAMRGDPGLQHDHGLVLERTELKRLLERMQELKGARLSELPGMDMRRRGTLPAAAAVLYQVLKSLELERLSTSEAALREGLLYEWIDHHRPELALSATEASPRTRAILRLVERYGADRPHAEHVRMLALSLFDALAPLHGLGADSRATLDWAALVHDIGHHVDARDHNRHGEYLILNSPMPGFTAPEVAVLGSVVRYHRGSRPKAAHPGFQALSRANQRRVEVLSALLRLADALDRSHHQVVRAVDVRFGGPADPVVISALGSTEVFLERWAAERRADPLQQVLGKPVVVEVVTETQPSGYRPA